MERKKMTKALIGESLKVLMRNHPFEKITIKMITDEAGVIRPTFIIISATNTKSLNGFLMNIL